MTVQAVKSWMTFFGWTNEGAPGAVKRAYGGDVIAKHGDAVWDADVEKARAQIERGRSRANAAWKETAHDKERKARA